MSSILHEDSSLSNREIIRLLGEEKYNRSLYLIEKSNIQIDNLCILEKTIADLKKNGEDFRTEENELIELRMYISELRELSSIHLKKSIELFSLSMKR